MQETPSWLTTRLSSSTAVFGHGRLKITLIALACMVLGFLVTSAFNPIEDGDIHALESDYENPAPEILEGPDVFSGTLKRPGRLSHSASKASKSHSSFTSDESVSRPVRKPSIKGALKELHNAVSDKVTLWKPWTDDDIEPEADLASPLDGTTNSTATPLKSEENLGGHEEDSLGHKTRIGKCTIVLPGSSIYERTVQTHALHDRIHGYPLHVLRQNIMDDVWSKPAYILSLLLRELAKSPEQRLEWLLWVDADTIMLNPYIPLEIFLPPSPQFDDINLLVTNDWNGLNNGVFPIRVCQWSVELLSAILAYRYYRPDADLLFRDQSAMDTLLKEKKFAAHTLEAPQRWFNAYQGEHNETLAPHQVRRGDFLVHFAGIMNRDERIMFWLDRAEQHLPEWEIEVQHTSYPTEIKEFWRQRSDERKTAQAQAVDMRAKANELLSQTDSRMDEYQDRLVHSDATFIRDRETALREMLAKDPATIDVTAINSELSMLELSLKPLKEALASAKKVLMKEAHDSIFAAEKDVMGQDSSSLSEIAIIEDKSDNLKSLIVKPEWSQREISNGIDELKQARANLQKKLEDMEAQKQKLKDAEDAAAVVAAAATKALESAEETTTITEESTVSASEPTIRSRKLRSKKHKAPMPTLVS